MTIVWPAVRSQVHAHWDADAPFSGSIGWAPVQSIHLVYEPLTTIHVGRDSEGVLFPDPVPRPRLALAWEPSDDFRVWDVRLRPGVVSAAGNVLSAEDVVWSYRRMFALRGVGVWRVRKGGGLVDSAAVEAIDQHRVRFTLLGPNPAFPLFLIFATGMIIDSAAARPHASANDPWAIDWLKANPAGFGPFRLVSATADAIEVAARDDYWAGRPGVPAMRQVAVDRREQAFRMIERGEANLIPSLYPDELARFAGRPEYRVERVRASHSGLDIDPSVPPFDDIRVRHAVAHALPYGRIFDEVYRGFARPMRSPIAPVSRYYDDSAWPYATDIDRARDLLREAGLSNGFGADLWVIPSAEAMRFGDLAQQALAEVGIGLDVHVGRSQRPGVPTLWFRDECGHALPDAMYDLAHDFDPPVGMKMGFGRERRWVDRLKAIRQTEAADQPAVLAAIQRDLLDYCTVLPIAEIQTGRVIREPIDPWAFGPDSLAVAATVWGGHRWDLGVW